MHLRYPPYDDETATTWCGLVVPLAETDWERQNCAACVAAWLAAIERIPLLDPPRAQLEFIW